MSKNKRDLKYDQLIDSIFKQYKEIPKNIGKLFEHPDFKEITQDILNLTKFCNRLIARSKQKAWANEILQQLVKDHFCEETDKRVFSCADSLSAIVTFTSQFKLDYDINSNIENYNNYMDMVRTSQTTPATDIVQTQEYPSTSTPLSDSDNASLQSFEDEQVTAKKVTNIANPQDYVPAFTPAINNNLLNKNFHSNSANPQSEKKPRQIFNLLPKPLILLFSWLLKYFAKETAKAKETVRADEKHCPSSYSNIRLHVGSNKNNIASEQTKDVTKKSDVPPAKNNSIKIVNKQQLEKPAPKRYYYNTYR